MLLQTDYPINVGRMDAYGSMSLSVKTISTHRTHILEKMKLKNNAELTLYAIQNGLTD